MIKGKTVIENQAGSENRTAIESQASHEVTAQQRWHSRRSDIIFAVVMVISLLLAWKVRDVLILLYVSALFAVVLIPVLRAVMRLRIGKWQPGRGAAVGMMLLVLGGAIALFVAFALPPVLHDLQLFVKEMPTRGPQLLGRIKRFPLASRLDVNALNEKMQDYASNSLGILIKSVSTWAGKLFDIITGIILTVYFMLEGDATYVWLLSFVPVEKRDRLNQTLLKAEIRMGKWLLGQGLLMLILGVSSTIVFVILHVRYAYALGVLMGAFNLIPIIGAMISMALVILAAAMDSWSKVLGVCIFYAIYAQVETSYLTPRIMQSSVDLAGLAVIVSLLLGAALAGVAGAMVSVPTAVLVAVLLNEYAVQRDPVLGLPERAPDLHAKAAV